MVEIAKKKSLNKAQLLKANDTVILIFLSLFPSARGLDIPAIKTVVNFDVSKTIDTHVHRIGRTGRAGEKGTAFTLLTNKDVQFAGDLVRNLVRLLYNVFQRFCNPQFFALARNLP